MSATSASFLAATLAVMFLGQPSEAVAQALQPRISLLPEHEHLLCVPPRPRLNDPLMYCADEDLSDMRGNFSAHCNATMGTVVWLIGGYAMVNRDQFSQQVYGVLVEDSKPNLSRFSLYPCGTDFLIGQFDGSFNITCQNMVNEVNLYRSSDPLFFHEGFPDIQPPKVTVTKCKDDGSYEVMFEYEIFTDTQVCAVAKAEDLSYDVRFSDNTDCEDVMVDENGVRVLCNTKDMTGNATIHVCGGSFCKSLTTPLTDVSCNRATWGFCKEDSIDTTITADKYEIRFRANFATYDGDWAIEVVSSPEENGGILVRDVFGGVSVGQPQTALYDATFDCDRNGGATITTPSTDDDGNSLQDSPGALAGIIITAVAVVAIIVVVFVSVCYCCKYCGDASEKKVVQDKSGRSGTRRWNDTNQSQQDMKCGVVGNPAYGVVHVQGSAGDGLEPDYNMENNPLYEMRIKSNERHSHETETAAGAGVYESIDNVAL